MKTFFSPLRMRLLPLLVRLLAVSISFLTAAARSPYFFPDEVSDVELDLGKVGSLVFGTLSKLVLLLDEAASSEGRLPLVIELRADANGAGSRLRLRL
jgi:hypothetical protein